MAKKYFTQFIFLSFLTFLFLSSCETEESSSPSSSATSVTVAEAEVRNLSDGFKVSSEVVAFRRSYVASRISGLIEDVNFEEGDRVREGDVMARLDVRQQRIALQNARIALDEARDVKERTEKLYETNAVARAELLTARRNFEQAEAEVERLELQVEFGEIRAPVDGVVTARLIEIGNNVSVNERVFTVANMDLLVVRPGISEMNLTGLEVGQQVDVSLDVYPGQSFEGSIRRIFPSVDAASRLFTVEVELLQRDGEPIIRPGFLARIHFAADDLRDVLTVPIEAVAERDGQKVIFALNENEERVELRAVDLGAQQDGYAVILSGLEEGEKVAAANLDALSDGSEVRVVGNFRRYGFRN